MKSIKMETVPGVLILQNRDVHGHHTGLPLEQTIAGVIRDSSSRLRASEAVSALP